MIPHLAHAAELAGLVVFVGDDDRVARLRSDFDELCDPRIIGLLLWLGTWCRATGLAVPHVTCLARTPADTARIYAAAGAPAPSGGSPHDIGPGNPLCRAADVRTFIYGHEDVDALVAAVCAGWGSRERGDVQDVAIEHNVGAGNHLHLQVPRAPAAATFWQRFLGRRDEVVVRPVVGDVTG